MFYIRIQKLFWSVPPPPPSSQTEVALQATLRAGKKHFLESLTRDASCTLRLSIDPEATPAGELQIDAWVAEVRVEHATDILHRGILRMPAPAQLVDAVATAAAYDVSRRRTGSDGEGQEGDSSSEENEVPLPPDVCMHVAGRQQLYFDGAVLSALQPKSCWTVQV